MWLAPTAACFNDRRHGRQAGVRARQLDAIASRCDGANLVDDMGRGGSAWVGTRFGLVRILPGGRVISYAVRTDLETDHVFSVLYTPSDGLLWIAHQSELAVFKPPPASSYEAEQGLEHAWESQSIARSGLRRPGNILDEHIALPQAPGDAVQLSLSQPGALTRVTDLLQSRSGAIRVISSEAIFDFSAGRFTLISDVRGSRAH
jgi:hypothetical protein